MFAPTFPDSRPVIRAAFLYFNQFKDMTNDFECIILVDRRVVYVNIMLSFIFI